MKYDLHTHSKYSADGFLEPEKIVETAMRKGLSGIAITDHNTINGALKAKRYELTIQCHWGQRSTER
jgi:predicted metal-dependent phosphoesterase TrpH